MVAGDALSRWALRLDGIFLALALVRASARDDRRLWHGVAPSTHALLGASNVVF